MTHALISLDSFKRDLNIAPTNSDDDARLWQVLVGATDLIQQRTVRSFLPHHATIAHRLRNPQTIALKRDLLTLLNVSDGQGTIPLENLDLSDDGFLNYPQGSFVPFANGEGAHITAIWGWHPDWSQAWQSIDSVQANPLSAEATTLIVTVAYEVGQILAIESEYLMVTAYTAETDSVTVTRGVLGTSASEHVLGTTIVRFLPAPLAMVACRQWATWLLRAQDEPTDHIPTYLHRALDGLRRISVLA